MRAGDPWIRVDKASKLLPPSSPSASAAFTLLAKPWEAKKLPGEELFFHPCPAELGSPPFTSQNN